MSDMAERLRACIAQAKATEPNRTMQSALEYRLAEAADRIEALERERDEAREMYQHLIGPDPVDSSTAAIVDAVEHWINCRFGGDASAEQIAALVVEAMGRSPDARASQAEASRMREALTYAAMGLGRIHDSLLSNGPKQASGEMAMHFRDKARAALEKP